MAHCSSTQEKVFANHNRDPPPRGNPGTAQPVKVNFVRFSDQAEEQAEVYAALDPSGRNRQYSILEVQGDYKDKPLTFLVDSGSSHLFISPNLASD